MNYPANIGNCFVEPKIPSRGSEDSIHVVVLKMLLYSFSFFLYLRPISSAEGIVTSIVLGVFAILLANIAYRAHLRLSAVLVLGAITIFLAIILGGQIRNLSWIASVLTIKGTFIASDVITFGIAAFCCVFVLRMLSQHVRTLSILEVLFVVGSVATTLAAHRNRMLNRPRFFSDWSWALGIEPEKILTGIGFIAAFLSVFLFLRKQRILKIISTALLLATVVALIFLFTTTPIIRVDSVDVLGLTGKDNKGSSKKDGKSSSDKDSNNPFKDNYENNTPPLPAAIAILRDDYEPRYGVLYFRQQVLSKYNGHHLVVSDKFDKDVISQFPLSEPAIAAPTQNVFHHIKLPTTMYLLVDHPQPPALTSANKIVLIENPHPTQFIAAYDVESLILTVSPQRLLGRESIPSDWANEIQLHYTRIPDDPRYKALSDLIMHSIDPRFANTSLSKAYAIKRYLEKEGFYTRKSTHSDKKDPTASFLFGSLRGYCVHFAHAAVYLLRSQGIAARVALGYAVQTNKRSGGSSILIMGDRAHAWPEIYVDGVGWITFDIYPERTDIPPAPPVDYDLEKLLGELARKDPTAGVTPAESPVVIPWRTIAKVILFFAVGILFFAYLIKIYRRFSHKLWHGSNYHRLAYIAVLDRLSDLGLFRYRGETRERHAQRIYSISPNIIDLTREHLAHALGSQACLDPKYFGNLVCAVKNDLKKNIHPFKRFLAFINPIGWLLTR